MHIQSICFYKGHTVTHSVMEMVQCNQPACSSKCYSNSCNLLTSVTSVLLSLSCGDAEMILPCPVWSRALKMFYWSRMESFQESADDTRCNLQQILGATVVVAIMSLSSH
jgi:hypothetical protein